MCIVATVDITIQNLCRGRLEYLARSGFEITVVCAPTPEAADIERRGVRLFTAPLRRAITPFTDLACLWTLWRFFRRERFDIIEVSTPKAALLGSIAARLAGAQCLIHLVRGLVYQSQGAIQRRLLRWSQWLPCRLSHYVVGVSHSMRQRADADGICTADRMIVLGEGSSNGVDLQQFSPAVRTRRDEVRQRWNIPADALVIGFVGRMTADKGVVELVKAFERVRSGPGGPYLLIVGAYEDRDRPAAATVEVIASHPRIRHVGWQDNTALFLGAMDLLALPSHREGFNNALLHAAAVGLPVVTTTAVGCRDAVRDGVTGICVAPGDTDGLWSALNALLSDPAMRERMGSAGRAWVEGRFDQEIVWRLQAALLHGMVEGVGWPVPAEKSA